MIFGSDTVSTRSCHPPSKIRDLVFSKINIGKLPISKNGLVTILYVEKTRFGRYDHKVGKTPDREFIDRLEKLIEERGHTIYSME